MNVRAQSIALDKLVITIPEGVLFQDLGSETIILNVESGEYYGSNEVGSRMWNLFHTVGSLSEVISTLLDEFEVSENRLLAELGQFLDLLQSKGLIEIHDTCAQ